MSEPTQESLTEVNFAAMTEAAHNHPGLSLMDCYAAGAAAVEAAVLARQPKPAPVAGHLRGEEIAAFWNVRDGRGDYQRNWYQVSANMQTQIVVTINAILATRPAAPAYFVTTEKAPTEADANESGYVLAFGPMGVYSDNSWQRASPEFLCSNSVKFTHWMPMPPAPTSLQSAEDKAFDAKWHKEGRNGELEKKIARVFWDEAKAFFTQEGATK